jgi:hypothetical protein
LEKQHVFYSDFSLEDGMEGGKTGDTGDAPSHVQPSKMSITTVAIL